MKYDVSLKIQLHNKGKDWNKDVAELKLDDLII